MLALRKLEHRQDTPADEDDVVYLSEATWADYQRLVAIRGDRSAPRITYLQGLLELMSPSRSHDVIKSRIGRLVEVYCLERGIEFDACGSWTIGDRRAKRGAEPDECYVFHGIENPKRPDLAIEVVWSSGRIDKLDVYRKLGVREVWYWRRGEPRRIQPYVLQAERYRASKRSKVLPGIDLAQLVGFVDLPTASQAIRAYRAELVRGQRLP
ncbi:MAG: Uma2 family endonuclease [Polyangiaceae bacterium]